MEGAVCFVGSANQVRLELNGVGEGEGCDKKRRGRMVE